MITDSADEQKQWLKKYPYKVKSHLPAEDKIVWLYLWLKDEQPGQIPDLVPAALNADVYIQYSAAQHW